uniref:Putative effector protein n=1 Tax=Heterodera avenae TaxID=34510 RepID=A0A2L0VDQ3_HETAV|nr:putative effector protein [Heterodera avenae]
MVAKLLPIAFLCLILMSFARCSPNPKAADVLGFKKESAADSCSGYSHGNKCCVTCKSNADCLGTGQECVLINLLSPLIQIGVCLVCN